MYQQSCILALSFFRDQEESETKAETPSEDKDGEETKPEPSTVVEVASTAQK